MAKSEKFRVAELPVGAGADAREMQDLLQQLVDENGGLNNWHSTMAQLPSYKAVRQRTPAYRGQLALAALANLQSQRGRVATTMVKLLESLMRGSLELDEAGLLTLLQGYGLRFDSPDPKVKRSVEPTSELIRGVLGIYPVALTLGQLEKLVKQNGLSPALTDYLTQFLAATQRELTGWLATDVAKLQRRLQVLLSAGGADARPVLSFAEGDAFGRRLAAFAAALPPDDPATIPWLHLLQSWQRASGGQPTAKYRQELDAAVAAIGPAVVRERGRELLAALAALRPEEVRVQGNPYVYTETRYLLEPSLNVAKGLIWTLQPLADEPLLALLATYATYCFHKVPGRGPLAAALGNACLLALAHNGLPGVAALARVRSRIKQTNTQALITSHIARASAALGVTPAEIEDLAIPDFDLREGQYRRAYGDYTATLALTAGKAEVHWDKNGQLLKSAPAALKATHAAELKQLKATQAEAQQTYLAQRARLDRSFVEDRRIPVAWFRTHYFDHGLLAELVRPLIWRFHRPGGTHTDALWLDHAWRDARRQPVAVPTDADAAQLWHPVLAASAEVLAWRALLEEQQVQQPIRQAFREVYLLTPPEEQTGTYSNRMAAHLLKQHQFNSLAKLRGWKYSLLGAYDKGYESDKATLALPAHGLSAEFWVSEVNADDAFNDSGIWHYVSTDQVRFVGPEAAAVPLPEVPVLVFSEVMRDVDLFVGVGSVGNDPLWRDNGGLVQYRNYWEQYSFGELGEVAKNRRLALERLVPRLKIGRVSEIIDRFLVVKGQLHTYKIHLGSGNILRSPHDQYLCIVPDRSVRAPASPDVFLPFEGDPVLSIILSKALLLMDDDKITDEAIRRQLR